MHLLILASYAPSLINFRGPLIRDIVSAGHHVSVGAPGIDDALRGAVETLGAQVFETPLNRNSTGMRTDLRYHQTLYRMMKQLRPDLVLTYTIKPNIWGALSAQRAGIPSYSLVTGLGFAFTGAGQGESFKSRVTRTIARTLYRLATRFNHKVIFQNPDDRADFIAAGCLKDEAKTVLVDGSGVDLKQYSRMPMVEAPVFLMIARLLVSKGVLEYAEAARQLRGRYPQARFVLVGPHDGGLDAVDPALVTQWHQQGVLEYLGPAQDVRPHIAATSIYVLPSYREGTPRSVLEAMAMGRAIVTSDAPGCRETIRDGEEGFLVEPRNATALADAMARFLDDPSLAARMGGKAYTRAVEKYDVLRINQQMMTELGLLPSSRRADQPHLIQ
jgi:glycosyltransferase involved in cell wall biosynthesis